MFSTRLIVMKLQNRCVKIIIRSKYNAHTLPKMTDISSHSITQGSTLDFNNHQRDDISKERLSLSLKNAFVIICQKGYILHQIAAVKHHLIT